MTPKLEEFCRSLSTEKSVVVCCHVSPDPDAIGSAGALQLILKDYGIQSCFYLPDAVPSFLESFTAECDIVSSMADIPAGAVAVVVDTANKDRTLVEDGFFETFGSERVYVIDHHESNPAWGTNNYIDPRAAASAVIVFQIAKQLGQIVGPEVATLLFAGLMDDTGSWRFSNSNGQSFLVAASLVAAGASPEEVANAIYFSVPEKVIKLRSMALGTLQTHCDGAVASIAVTRQMLEACDATIEDSDGIVDIARSLQGVRCAVFMREREQGWRVSLRAKDSSIDVNQVAGVFSGGGHPAAAGATIPSGSLESAIDSVIEVISKQL